MRVNAAIKVLIVDDSKVFCEVMSQGIKEDARIEIVGYARDPFEARDKILYLEPDVMLLDIELPRMDGVTFLKKLMPQYPLPTVMVSAHEQLIPEALEAGAVDYVKKPVGKTGESIQGFFRELIVKIKIAAMTNVSGYKHSTPFTVPENENSLNDKIIAIGASTGGTEAIFTILKELPRDIPGIVIVQHMPENFTKMYAERLNSTCKMEVKEAQDGDYVKAGRVLIAPGGCHMKLLKNERQYRITCFDGAKVNGHRPSVDVLFSSVAKAAGVNAVGVILTGMGFDGANGLLEMRQAGSYTIGQDQASSIVYGMPKVAFDVGGVCEQLPLNKIGQKLYTFSCNRNFHPVT